MSQPARRQLTVQAAGLAVCAACAFAAAPLRAQTPAETLQQQFAKLQAYLGGTPRPTLAERRDRLQEFLQRHGSRGKVHEVLQARLLLGHLSLRLLDGNAAQIQFRAVARDAEGVHDEAHAMALYGNHQAYALMGHLDEANASLRQVTRRFPKTTAAACARVARAHLETGAVVAVGRPLPAPAFGLDVRGELAAPPADRPRLLVFWSLEHEPSTRRLTDLAQAWRRAGQPASSLIAYALEPDARLLRGAVDRQQWQFPVLAGHESGFLHPDWILLRVTAVPSALLVDARGVLLARDVAPSRIEAMLAR